MRNTFSRTQVSNLAREVSCRLPPSPHTKENSMQGLNISVMRASCSSACSSSVCASVFGITGSMDARRLSMFMTRPVSVDWTFSRHSRRMKSRQMSTYWSSMVMTLAPAPENLGSMMFSAQLAASGRHPRYTASIYTIPHRETVAGEATERSLTSNTMAIVLGSLILSPLLRQRVLLSSSTVFILSIQMASTGPSQITHFLEVSVAATPIRTIVAIKPSVHSLVMRLNSPYNSPMVIALGLRTDLWTVSYLSASGPLSSCRAVMASDRVFTTVDLPVQVTPTIMTPCRTCMVSYS
mmetsp:Transcript_10880/g.24732  ORF Transcript_10880/g.24732 Transcript_10880/m.24732 type:complete len:295 (-) Transcript_10880:5133-6017(-)